MNSQRRGARRPGLLRRGRRHGAVLRLVLAVNYFGVSQLLDGLQGALAKGQQPAALVIGSVAATHPGPDGQPMVEAMLAGDEAQALAVGQHPRPAPHRLCRSKYAITSHARRLAVSWGKQGMRLNVVAPGAVETPLHQASLDDARFGKAVGFCRTLGACRAP